MIVRTLDTTAPVFGGALAAEQAPGSDPSQVRVTWAATNANDLSRYVIYYKTSSMMAQTADLKWNDALPAGVTRLNVTKSGANGPLLADFVPVNVQVGATYFFIVRAVDDEGNESNGSVQVQFTIPDFVPIGDFAGVTSATWITTPTTGLRVQWTQHAQASGGYRVEWRRALVPDSFAGVPWDNSATVATGTGTFTISGAELSEYTKYQVRVFARKLTSTWDTNGTISAAVTIPDVTPPRFSGTSLTSTFNGVATAGGGGFNLSWSGALDTYTDTPARDGTGVKEYVVYLHRGVDRFNVKGVVSHTGSGAHSVSVTQSDLQTFASANPSITPPLTFAVNSSYIFSVTARDFADNLATSNGTGTLTSSATIFPDITPPDQPTNVTFAGYTPGSPTGSCSFTVRVAANSNLVNEHRISVFRSGSSTALAQVLRTTGQQDISVTIPTGACDPGTSATYSITVTATNLANAQESSALTIGNYVVDKVAPTATITASPSTGSGATTFNIIVEANEAGTARLDIPGGANLVTAGALNAGFARTMSFTGSALPVRGVNTVRTTLTDTAGNTATFDRDVTVNLAPSANVTNFRAYLDGTTYRFAWTLPGSGTISSDVVRLCKSTSATPPAVPTPGQPCANLLGNVAVTAGSQTFSSSATGDTAGSTSFAAFICNTDNDCSPANATSTLVYRLSSTFTDTSSFNKAIYSATPAGGTTTSLVAIEATAEADANNYTGHNGVWETLPGSLTPAPASGNNVEVSLAASAVAFGTQRWFRLFITDQDQGGRWAVRSPTYAFTKREDNLTDFRLFREGGYCNVAWTNPPQMGEGQFVQIRRSSTTTPPADCTAGTLAFNATAGVSSTNFTGAECTGTGVSFAAFVVAPNSANYCRTTSSTTHTVTMNYSATLPLITTAHVGNTPSITVTGDTTNTKSFGHTQTSGDLANWTGVNTVTGLLVTTGTTAATHTLDFTNDATYPPWSQWHFKLMLSDPHQNNRVGILIPVQGNTAQGGTQPAARQRFTKVPPGMVFIGADDWPANNAESGLTYAPHERFGFAIDQFEASVASGSLSNCDGSTGLAACGNGVLQSVPTGAPAQSLNWFAYKRGCNNRSSTTALQGYVDANEMRQVRLATGIEYIIAAHGTPDVGGTGNCNIDNRGNPAAPDATSANSNAACVSTYGARNMIGNLWEWTDELLTDRSWVRGWGSSFGSSEAETLPIGAPSETNGNTAVLAYDRTTAFPVMGTRTGPWSATGDHIWQSWGGYGSTPTSSRARAGFRGGGWNDGTNAGRFALSLNNGPTFTLTVIGGRCALSQPAPGFVRFRSDSEADQGRFMWRLQGNNITHATAPTTVRLALAKSRALLDAWDGAAVAGSTLADDVFTITNFSQCNLTLGSNAFGYNSTVMETPGTGSVTSGALGLQGRCGISISSLPRWQKRWVKLSASNSFGSTFSETLVIARVPSGMVFVSADDWPESAASANMPTATEMGETYPEANRFDFAIDKYEVSVSGTVADCTSDSFPCTAPANGGGNGGAGHLASTGATPAVNLDWYTYKQGCLNRATVLTAESNIDPQNGVWQGATADKQVHLATGLEWMVASFGTPDATGPGFCNTTAGTSPAFWNPGAPASQIQTGANSMELCASRYGARNMIGNQWEWTDDLFHNQPTQSVRRFWTSTNNGNDVGITDEYFPITTGSPMWHTGWGWLRAFPTASTTTQGLGLSGGDGHWKNHGAMSGIGDRARAGFRGGSWGTGTNAGRFALNLSAGPTSGGMSATFGGRCALSRP